jgi:ribose-phosphate pyrophosphokinase
VIFTAMPYARQDKAYYRGELNAAETLCKTLLKRYGVGQITTIDAHFANEGWSRKLPIFNVSASGTLIDAARADHPGIVFMAPDAGSTRRSRIKGAKKIRKNSYEVQVSLGEEFSDIIKGRDVAVVDDILATGTTLECFYHEARKSGAEKVFALITHGVCREGIDRIHAVYDGLYMTNSVKWSESNVPVNDLVWGLILKGIKH